MKLVKTVDAEGHILCHDLTRIVKDVSKGVAFKKGHIVTKEDIPILLNMGKEHLYIWENDDTVFHENEAADILATMCGQEHMRWSEVKEGKIDIYTDINGYFMSDTTRLTAINKVDEIMIATRHSGTPVRKGEKLAGTRIIPLVISKEKLLEVQATTGREPLLKVIPYQKIKVGIITTGNEVFYGRITDTFAPVIKEKLAEYDVEVLTHKIVSDDPELIKTSIQDVMNEGAEMVICTGGMSVDPDDRTPLAIKSTGATIISYGAPVLPGAMFLMAYTAEGIPIMGLPGCVMYSKRTIFDIVLPRVLAGIVISKEWLASLGNGGLCLDCDNCTYPNCGFGK